MYELDLRRTSYNEWFGSALHNPWKNLNDLTNLKRLRLSFGECGGREMTKEDEKGIASLAKTHRNIERFDLIYGELDETTVVDYCNRISGSKACKCAKM